VLESLADPCPKAMDGVYLTAWTQIRPPVYSANERIKESGRFSRRPLLRQMKLGGKPFVCGIAAGAAQLSP
jgi:hypothetical protein